MWRQVQKLFSACTSHCLDFLYAGYVFTYIRVYERRGCLGKRDPNPYWFNIEIFAVIASNTLKIRQVFSAAFSLYQQKSLMLNCSHLPMRCFTQDFSAEGCRQADACQIRQAERLQKHPSPGNACSSLVCL